MSAKNLREQAFAPRSGSFLDCGADQKARYRLAVFDQKTGFSYFARTFFSLAKRGRESCLGSLGSPWIRGST